MYGDFGTPDFRRYEFDDSEGIQAAIDIDHSTDDTPVMTAFLRRGAETVWVNAYLKPRLVIETYPTVPAPDHPGAWYAGMVREIPYGRATLPSERFADSVLRLEREGWTHAPVQRVWVGDPWDADAATGDL